MLGMSELDVLSSCRSAFIVFCFFLGGAMSLDYPELSVLTDKVIGAAIEVHRHLGPGLLESVYETCLEYELKQLGLVVERQMPLCVVYKELVLPQAYRIDLVVENALIVEIKAVEKLNEVHAAQILSYMKFNHCRVGLLMNFNVKLLKDGLRRFVMKAV